MRLQAAQMFGMTRPRYPAEAPGRTENGLGNLAARNVDQLAATVRCRLRRIQ